MSITSSLRGRPDRAGMGEPLLRRDHEAAALGPSVELEQHGAEPVDHRPLDLGCHRRRAVHDQSQRRHVVPAPHLLREPEQAHELRRHHERRRDAVLLDGPEHRLGVESLEEHQRRAEQRGAVGVGERGGVVQRRADEMGTVGVVAEAPAEHLRAGLAEAPRRGALHAGAQHALRAAGGARGVHHVVAGDGAGEVVTRERLDLRPVAEPGDRPAEREATLGRDPRGRVGDEVGEAGLGDEHVGLAVADHVRHVVGRPPGRHRGEPASRPLGAAVHREELRHVAGHHRHTAPLRYADRVQGPGEPVAGGDEVGVGEDVHGRTFYPIAGDFDSPGRQARR